jgi:hypothetical protein
MKKLFFLSIFLIAAICSNAQETGKIILVKVYQETAPSGHHWTSSIRIIHSDNTIEAIELDRSKDEKDFASADENDKKIRNALEKISTMGYEIKTSDQTIAAGSFIITTYVFEKK